MNKNIIILIGQGKSTLTDFFVGENASSMPDCKLGAFDLEILTIHDYIVCHGLDGILNNIKIIKKINDRKLIITERQYDTPIKYVPVQQIIVHLQNESDIKEIPLSIKNRALIFNLSI